MRFLIKKSVRNCNIVTNSISNDFMRQVRYDLTGGVVVIRSIGECVFRRFDNNILQKYSS